MEMHSPLVHVERNENKFAVQYLVPYFIYYIRKDNKKHKRVFQVCQDFKKYKFK